MGLEQFAEDKSDDYDFPSGISEKIKKQKMFDETLCPTCGQDGEVLDHWYNRCTNEDCDTITYIPTNR